MHFILIQQPSMVNYSFNFSCKIHVANWCYTEKAMKAQKCKSMQEYIDQKLYYGWAVDKVQEADQGSHIHLWDYLLMVSVWQTAPVHLHPQFCVPQLLEDVVNENLMIVPSAMMTEVYPTASWFPSESLTLYVAAASMIKFRTNKLSSASWHELL